MIPALATQYTLFISYADEDKDWVLGHLLPAVGLPAERRITRQEFRPGAPKVAEFVRAVTESRYTLLVLSPAYLKSEWSVFGEQLASHARVKSGRDQLIPLVLEPCELPLQIDFLTELDCRDRANWESELARLRGFLELPEPAAERIECPYPGMKPYGVETARSFFGRSKEIQDLKAQVRLQPFLIVIGPSGSGKSSLVFAGLVPSLEKTEAGQWLVRSMRPGLNPLNELAKRLDVETASGATMDWAGAARALLEREKRGRLLLVIDQLEEVFSLPSKEAQGEFLTAIRSLRKCSECVALLTMRADFFGSLLDSDLAPIDTTTEQMNISPLRGSRLREAIVKPAETAGVYLEPALVDRLLTDAADEPGILPMLQETMVLLWDKMDRRLITLDAYTSLDPHAPGIAVALSIRGKAALAGLSDSQRRVARRILLRLVNFGQGRADTRRQLLLNDLRSAGEDAADFTTTLDQLVNHRIVTLDADLGPHTVRVDLSHECLITGWPLFHDWVQTRRDAELTRRRLCAKAEEWIRLGRKNGGLLDKTELADAEKWIGSPDGADLGVEPGLDDLVRASRRRLRWLVVSGTLIAVGFVLLAVGIVWVLALFTAQRTADEANALLTKNNRGDSREAIRKALRAVQIRETPYTREVLHHAVQAFQSGGRMAFASAATGVAFSEDGTQLAGVSLDGEVTIVQDPDTGAGQRRLDPPGESIKLFGVAFRPNGRELAAAASNGNVIVWDLTTGEKRSASGHEGPVMCVAYNRAGNLLATGSQDQAVIIRDAATLEIQRKMTCKGRVNRLAFSPNGVYLAAACAGNIGDRPDDLDAPADYAARLWNVKSGSEVGVLRGHARQVTDVAFNPDPASERIVTSSADGRLRIWDSPYGKPPKTLHLDSGGAVDGLDQMALNAFSAVTFDQHGHLASARTALNNAEIWDVRAGIPVDTLRGHKSGINALAYNGSGGRHKLASAGEDHDVRIYYLELQDLIAWAKRLVDGTPAARDR